MLKRKLLVLLMLQTTLTTPMALAASDVRAKIMRCAKQNPQRCEVLFSRPLEGQEAKTGFDLYRGTKLIYSAKTVQATSSKRHPYTNSQITEGRWHISQAQRRKIINNALLLRYMPKSQHQLNESHQDSYLLTADGDTEQSPNPEPPRSMRDQPDELNNLNTFPNEPQPSHLERLERWASRTDGNDAPRINITARVGTPNSPSSMLGASVDTFFVSHVLPITVSAGEYDSLRFVDGKYGRLKYHTQSLGTGLLIGKSWTRFKIGANYTEIRARFRPSQSVELGGYTASKRTYSGLTPHIGLYGISSGEISYAFDYGTFLPLDTSYGKDPGAPYQANSQPSQYRNRKQFFSFGLGLAF